MKALIFITTMLLSQILLADVVVDPKKSLIIAGPIVGESLVPLAREMLYRAQIGEKEIQLVIDSPGGEVGTGYMFIDALEAVKAYGVTVTCFVPHMAASMGYQIFMHCNKRYVLSHALLLWHHVRVDVFMAMLGVKELLPLARDLAKIDAHILEELLAVMGEDMSTNNIKWYFDHETLHTGYDLASAVPNVMTAYSYIPGLLEVLTNPDVPRTEVKDGKQLRFKTPVYLYPER